MQADAQRRGFSQAYIDSIPEQMQAQRDSLYGKADQYAASLVTDPAALQATLAALYTPEKIKEVQIDEQNPAWGLVGGILGATVGGLAGGGSGAMLGYSIGSGAGQILGLEG